MEKVFAAEVPQEDFYAEISAEVGAAEDHALKTIRAQQTKVVRKLRAGNLVFVIVDVAA